MTAASANQSREIVPLASLVRHLLLASENPYAQTAAGLSTGGYARSLQSQDPFLGFFRDQVRTADAPTADGDLRVEIEGGLILAKLPITGVAQDDVYHQRKVYAADDNTFAMAGSGTLIGVVVGVAATNQAWVLCIPSALQPTGIGARGFRTLSDADATLTTADLDKVLFIPNTAARTLTLPPAADCTGRFLTIKKTTAAAFAATLDGNASETIDGATTFAAIDAAQDTVSLISDGSNWHILARQIA